MTFSDSKPKAVSRALAKAALLACLAGTISACVPLLMGGAMVGGTLVALDRRTAGALLEDEGIELRSVSRVRENLGDRAHVNIASYNRQVLLTGEVPSAQDKQLVEQIIGKVENVRAIINEIGVLGNSTLPQRSSDALVTGKVKAGLVDAKDLYANAFKVVTERGTTYMLGRVTQREADRATDIARSVVGVQKVVRIFETISEDDLKRLLPEAPPASKSQETR